ncbi:DUF4468 domain-containing protein [Parabacteroides sp. 52]|uniref:DUF4468 domain-containing protein n=1 Tax=unclassified Parabacteroides TaxID=2649774 RepID=UPI0013D75AA3|nr:MULTISPECIES: DUF4468 domain-containing protein [unclassified Parabacteroides]MDH6534413.1 hypothetical protein [Parabacteroides sp. PM5-20]NDV54912.1 DUF4468 domain-containing protein [Parabacteroides sp. 52]
MKKYLLLFALIIPTILSAQENERYLAGAISLDNGKVVFTKEVTHPALSQEELYDKLLIWAKQRYNTPESRVAYTNKEEGNIAVIALDTLVFARTALSLDQSGIIYRMVLNCTGNSCLIKIDNIRYQYNVSYKREPEKLLAEEVITDKYALTRNKLNRVNGKFRRSTINLVDEIFNEIDQTVGNTPSPAPQPPVQTQTPVKTNPVAQVTAPPAVLTTKDGYMSFTVDKIPQALITLLADSPMHVSPEKGQDKKTEKKASWKGFGTLFNKTITTITLSEDSPVYKQINGLYTLSFLKEETDDTPWMIIECQKQGETTEESQKTIIGEVLTIWIK